MLLQESFTATPLPKLHVASFNKRSSGLTQLAGSTPLSWPGQERKAGLKDEDCAADGIQHVMSLPSMESFNTNHCCRIGAAKCLPFGNLVFERKTSSHA